MFRRHPILSIATFVYLGVVAWVTLGPQPLDAQGSALLYRLIDEFSQHSMTQWLTYSRVEFLANIAMFVPIGVFFVLLMGRKWWLPAIFAGVGMTFTIEFIQLFLPTRVPDVRDLISNSIGACAGVFVALVITWPRAYRDWREERAMRLAGAVR